MHPLPYELILPKLNFLKQWGKSKKSRRKFIRKNILIDLFTIFKEESKGSEK